MSETEVMAPFTDPVFAINTLTGETEFTMVAGNGIVPPLVNVVTLLLGAEK